MIIHSFLEHYDFSGKTIIPFCTFYTAQYQTLSDITGATPESNHLEGFSIRGAESYNAEIITNWLDRINLNASETGIKNVRSDVAADNGMIFNICGNPVGDDISNLPAGIYIRNGQKIVKK